MKFRSLHPNLRIRIVVGSVQRFLHVMVMPLMTVFLAERFGVAVAGAMVLVIAVCEVSGSLLGGYLADIHGRRPLLLAGEAGVVAAYVTMAAAATPWWENTGVVYAGFLAASLASNLAVPANDAMIVDVSTPESRQFVYTINYWSINFALACGVLIGGFLYRGYFPQLLAAVAAGSLVVFLVTFVKISETAPEGTAAEKSESARAYVRSFASGYRAVLADRLFSALLIAATLRMAIEVQINYYINVRVSETFGQQRLFGLGSWDAAVDGVEILGILRAENTILVVLLALVVHRLLRRVGDRPRLYAGVILFTGGYMVMAVSGNGWVLLAAMLVLTVGELLNVPVQQTMLADLVPERSRTKYMAVFNLNVRLALLIASLCMTLGAVVSRWGIAALYAVFGAVIVLKYRTILVARDRGRPETDAEGSVPVGRPAQD
ncbi:MFS transporter [Streptomyces sp. NPDC014864]|uniref:MFS transporter n=1 Tax=Streptomyces sp. NPDC014864 TaxID=3364924 RepID=UPI0036FCFE2F